MEMEKENEMGSYQFKEVGKTFKKQFHFNYFWQ